MEIEFENQSKDVGKKAPNSIDFASVYKIYNIILFLCLTESKFNLEWKL